MPVSSQWPSTTMTIAVTHSGVAVAGQPGRAPLSSQPAQVGVGGLGRLDADLAVDGPGPVRAGDDRQVEFGDLRQVVELAGRSAARCVLAAGGAELVDFAFRRTQGPGAGVSVARASAIAGFAATSNVEAARRFGLAAAGTMAHSFIEAYRDEEAAFTAFAEDFPGKTTFLVDTYDTEQGVRTAIEVARRLRLPGPVGVRLDSGDLARLARSARRLLDEAGLPGARIFASGGLDEYAIAGLVADQAPIGAYGVGTKMGVSADAPSLDSAYKLVAYAGRPVMKLSPGA